MFENIRTMFAQIAQTLTFVLDDGNVVPLHDLDVVDVRDGDGVDDVSVGKQVLINGQHSEFHCRKTITNSRWLPELDRFETYQFVRVCTWVCLFGRTSTAFVDVVRSHEFRQ